MIGSSLYFIALLASADVETAENITQLETTQEVIAIEETVAEPVTTPVTLTNNIDATMLKYKHWTGTYSPDIFNLSINGTIIAPGETYTFEHSTKTFSVSFDYSFMNGMRTGTKAFSYSINENSTNIALTFSWLEPNKVILDNATLITT